MLSDRMKTLLREVGKTLCKQSDPFETWWLVEHEVTIDECWAMSNNIGLILQWFVKQKDSKQAEILFSDLGEIGQMAALLLKEDELLEQLKNFEISKEG